MVQLSDVSRVVLIVMFLSVVSICAYGQSIVAFKCSDGKWGFKDGNGSVVIPCKYKEVDDWFIFDGKRLAAVKLNGYWGCIDEAGCVVVNNIYVLRFAAKNKKVLREALLIWEKTECAKATETERERVAVLEHEVKPLPEILPTNENINPIVASTNVVEKTEMNIVIDDLPVNKSNSFLYAGTSNFGLITGDGTTIFNLYANGGYFVANKFSVVVGLGFEMISVGGNSVNILGFNTGFRYYLVKANNGGLFINSLLNVTKPNDLKAELGLTLGAGYSFFLNNRVSFEPTANFVMPFKEGSSNIFIFGGGFSIFF